MKSYVPQFLLVTILWSVSAIFVSPPLKAGLNAEEEPVQLKIGDAAPSWEDLIGTDDKKHSLADLKDQQVIVVCFTCNSCPYAVDYEDRLIEFHKKFAARNEGVTLIAINSNIKPAERLDKMKERAKAKEFQFPYLMDETQQVAASYGANFTPEFYVLDKDRRIVYTGAMDDQTAAEKVQQRFVELAVEAALKGELRRPHPIPQEAVPFRTNGLENKGNSLVPGLQPWN